MIKSVIPKQSFQNIGSNIFQHQTEWIEKNSTKIWRRGAVAPGCDLVKLRASVMLARAYGVRLGAQGPLFWAKKIPKNVGKKVRDQLWKTCFLEIGVMCCFVPNLFGKVNSESLFWGSRLDWCTNRHRYSIWAMYTCLIDLWAGFNVFSLTEPIRDHDPCVRLKHVAVVCYLLLFRCSFCKGGSPAIRQSTPFVESVATLPLFAICFELTEDNLISKAQMLHGT